MSELAVSDLALLGGPKTVDVDRSHFTWPVISDATRAAVMRQLDECISIYNRSGIIEKLENRLRDYHGTKHALLTNSGTAALHSMFAGARLEPGDEVICPAYTFYATVTPLFNLGVRPVLAECEADGNISAEDVERRITPKTKAIMVTHMWGIPCDMAALQRVAHAHGLLLFEDISHACGAKYDGVRVGSFGDASALSLQAQKTLTGGEGGVVLTSDDEIFYRALAFGHYNKRCKVEIPKDHELAPFAVTGIGLKLRIHPLAAAIADQQLDELDGFIAARQTMTERMMAGLSEVPSLEMPIIPSNRCSSWYAFVMQYKPEQLGGLSIDRFYEALHAEGCSELDRPSSTRPLNQHALFQRPGDLFPAYRDMPGYGPDDFPRAGAFHEGALKLPVWHDPADVELCDLYIEAFRKVAASYQDLL